MMEQIAPRRLREAAFKRRVAPHPHRTALTAAVPKVALRADGRVAGEYQGSSAACPAPLRPGRPHASAEPAVDRDEPALAHRLVADREQRDPDIGLSSTSPIAVN